jgi:zinc/manganese transport system permease protein
MSLMSDVLQHGVLPSVAVGAASPGLSIWVLGLGGVVAGGREDSQLAGMCLLALAAGVALISAQHSLDLRISC